MTTEEKRRRRFSEDFRRKQVALIEQGTYTITEVCRLYDVRYYAVKKWVEKFGKKSSPGTIYVHSEKDIDRLREMEKEVDKLKKIIGEQQIQILYQSKVIELAKGRLGEDFEKK
jgi:transposase-like protein